MPEPSYLFPAVVDRRTAIQAGGFAIGAAALKAMIKLLLVLASIGLPITQLSRGPEALVSAALFAAVAFGIYRLSRVAAVAGLLLGVVDSVGATPSSDTVAIILLMCFATGIRATLLFHRLPSSAKQRPQDAA